MTAKYYLTALLSPLPNFKDNEKEFEISFNSNIYKYAIVCQFLFFDQRSDELILSLLFQFKALKV